MVARQDISLTSTCRLKSRHTPQRSASNSREHLNAGLRRKKEDSRPFEQEINIAMEKSNNRRTVRCIVDNSNKCERNSPVPMDTDFKSARTVEFHSEDSERENMSGGNRRNRLNDGFLGGDSSTADDSDQYLNDLHPKKMDLISSDSEKDKEKPLAKSKSRNCERNSRKTEPCILLRFPSSAATPREAIHEHSTSDDEKEGESNTKSFYGSKPSNVIKTSNVIQTYGIKKKSRRIIDKTAAWTEDDDDDEEIDVGKSDTDDLPVKNTKKRKLFDKKVLIITHNITQ
jgi:hypothetical protein